jgi:hypothetical protein
MNGHSLAYIGKLLGHRHLSTTARYAHLAQDGVRATADDIAASIGAVMGAEPPANDNTSRQLAGGL